VHLVNISKKVCLPLTPTNMTTDETQCWVTKTVR